METPPSPKPGGENLTEQIARSLQRQRERVSEFVASQRRRVDSVEARLSERIKTLLDHLDRDRRDAEAASRQIEQQSQHTSREKETLEQLRKTLDEQQQQWQTFQQQTQRQQEQLIEQARCQSEEVRERLQRLLEREPEIQAAEEKLRDEGQALELARREHESERRQLATLEKQLETERDRIRDKRHRIAQALKQQRREQFEEINRQRDDLARRESAQLDDFHAQVEATTGSDGEATLRNMEQQSEHIAKEREAIERLKETLDEQRGQLRTIQKEIGDEQAQFLNRLQERQDKLDARSQQLDQQEPDIRAANETLREERQALELAHQKQEAELRQIATLREQLRADQAELQSEREQLAASQSKTDSQRRHIARALKQQKTSQLKEVNRRREKLANRRDAELSELRSRLDVAASEQGLADELREEIAVAKGRETELAAEIEELKAAARQGSHPSDGHEIAASEENEDLRRRHKMAIEDLKELKAANAELQQQLNDARAGNQETTARVPDSTLDWEAEKLRIISALEREGGGVDEQRAADQLEIEGVIQMTDGALADKDREIAELKLLLENQSDNFGAMAVGATALGEVLDSDSVIREGRENLERLQETWQKKLSQAEIEISTERAKLAREKLDIEEKVRLLEKSLSQRSGQPAEDERAGQPTQHRWLTRLGLTND